VRRRYRAERIRSARSRSVAEEAVLAKAGARVVVHELQGDLFFATTEMLVWDVLRDLEGVEYVVLDAGRVGQTDAASRAMLASLGGSLAGSERTLLLSGFSAHVATVVPPDASFADVDGALLWCEQQALDEISLLESSGARLHGQQLLEGLTDAELAAVEARVELVRVDAGERVFREGEPADTVCFVLEGSVSVVLPLVGLGRSRRVAGFGRGMAVGDFGLVESARRSADVIADEAGLLAALPVAAVAEIDAEHPGVAVKVYANLARTLAQRLRNANDQLRALDS
jgi:glutaminase